MTVLNYMLLDESREGHREKTYVDTFQQFLPIAVGQVYE